MARWQVLRTLTFGIIVEANSADEARRKAMVYRLQYDSGETRRISQWVALDQTILDHVERAPPQQGNVHLGGGL